jgi:hypothetical protein
LFRVTQIHQFYASRSTSRLGGGGVPFFSCFIEFSDLTPKIFFLAFSVITTDNMKGRSIDLKGSTMDIYGSFIRNLSVVLRSILVSV